VLLDIASAAVDVVITRSQVVGQTMERLAATVGQQPFSRGVFVQAITRAGTQLPLGPGLVVERGDVMTLVGAKHHLEQAAPWLGAAHWPTPATDMLAVTVAIGIGWLVGLLAVIIGDVEVGLSLPVGILAGGLVTGYLRSLRPVFGHVPEPALWLFESLGLSAFIALIGIGAGPGFLSGLRQSGGVLLGAAVVVSLVPNVVAILVGQYVFRLHPGILLGVCAGAGASSAGLAAVQDAARSRIPTLGYGVSYAVGNVLLALWGSVLVVLLARAH